MYLCVMGINVASFDDFIFDFGIVITLFWYILFSTLFNVMFCSNSLC